MKKRKIKNVILFTIFLSLSLLLFFSQSVAGTNSKLTNSTKNTSVKDTQKVQGEQKQKAETKPDTTEKSSNPTSTKSTEVKKNTTTDDEKEKSSEKKKPEVKTSVTIKKSKDSTNNTQHEKTELKSSNKTEINAVSNKTADDTKKYNIDIQKNNTSKSESIINPKFKAALQNSNDNEMIKNPLNNDTSSNLTRHYVPRQTIEIDEIEKLDDVHTVSYDNVEYKCHNGYYYRHWGRHYRRMRPPWGLRIRWLPRYYYIYIFDSCRYYYCCNVYYIYIESDDEYIVVRPPIGALVETLPEYSEKLIVEGETYFIADGIQYKAVLVNDEIWFKVIKVIDDNEYAVVELPVGALIEIIPEDRELLFIDGETYFIAENIQYKAVLVNDEIWFKVLKVG